MHQDRDEFNHKQEHSYQNDPFREASFVYKSSQNSHREENQKPEFKLKLKKTKAPHNKPPQENPVHKLHIAPQLAYQGAAPQSAHQSSSHSSSHNSSHKKTKTNTLRNILEDFGRQIVASTVFLIIGFVVMNWSAYAQLAESRIDNFFNGDQHNILDEIAGEKPAEEVLSSAGEKSPGDDYPEKTLREHNSKQGNNLEAANEKEEEYNAIPPLNMQIAPSDNRIIIPRINQNLPLIRVSSENLIKRDWGALETDIQDSLKDGVVHYPGTSLPGQKGNVVITGHSSYFPWDPGRFKDVFALLHDVEQEDKVVLYYNQKKYIYQIEEKFEVYPDEIDILKQTPDDRLTLITCTPIGTNIKRLILVAKPVLETN